jgi:hypothetical protein
MQTMRTSKIEISETEIKITFIVLDGEYEGQEITQIHKIGGA